MRISYICWWNMLVNDTLEILVSGKKTFGWRTDEDTMGGSSHFKNGAGSQYAQMNIEENWVRWNRNYTTERKLHEKQYYVLMYQWLRWTSIA